MNRQFSKNIKLQVEEVRQRISSVVADGQQVKILAVSKGQPASKVLAASQVGLVDFGENYAQELLRKQDELSEQVRDVGLQLEVDWHFIGAIQRNKIKKLAGLVSLWQSIDRVELISELASRCPNARILLQVNTTGEAQKAGCEPNDLSRLIETAEGKGLVVEGLMTLGPTKGDPSGAFDQLRSLAEKHEVKTLSMGMSRDFELAVAHGATLIRLGTSLFGERRP